MSQPQPNIQRPQHPAMQHSGPVPTPTPGHRGAPYMHFPPQHIGHGGPVPGQFPPHLQQALNNHLQALSQQIATQIASHASHTGQANFNPIQGHVPQRPQTPQPSFQQVIAQHQQARAAAGQQGMNNATQTSRENTASPGQDTAAFAPLRSSTPANVSTVVRENQGSTGESWRMVIQSTITAQNPQLPRVPTPVSMNLGMPGLPAGPFASPAFQHSPALTQAQLQARMLENEMSSIQSALSRGTAPAPSVFENARTILRNLEASEGDLRIRPRLDQLSMQAEQLRANLNNMLMRVASEQPVPASLPQHQNANPVSSQSNGDSSIYLLSSPSGPQALLVSPWGTYSAPWHVPALPPTSLPININQNTHQSVPSNPNANTSEAPPQSPPGIPGHDLQAQPRQQQQQQNQQANEARDLLRLLIPLGGHIWLLVRLFGFVYFFTAGGGSRRTILLGAFAFLVFIAQTGVFRPFIQAVWNPLRQHIEGLLPMPGNDPARAPVPAPGAQNPSAPAANTGAGRRDQQNTSQEATARLLQEQGRRDIGALREQFRRAERALALFVGSLVPGFGERHIAARDAAEVARLAEDRRREEEEERSARISSQESNEEVARPQEPDEGEGPANQGQVQAGSPQAALVEI